MAFELLQKEGFSIKEKLKTANPIYTLLMKAKADVEKAGFNYKSLRQNSRYVWVEDSNNTIGRKPAHYEFISRRNTLYLELHFEETKSKSLFQQLIKNLPEQLEWFDWNGSQSIRHKNSYSLYDQYIDSKIVNDLIEFDSLIGNKVRSILMNESKQYWLYAPGENAYLWDEFYQGGILGLGWDEIGDLSQYKSRDEIKKALVDTYGGTESKKNDVSANDDFLNKIKIGDVIIAKKGRGELLGYGVVTSDYIFDKNRKNYQKTRQIDWKIKGNWNVDFSLVLKTLTDITKYSSEETEYDTYYEKLLGIMGVGNPKNSKEIPLNAKVIYAYLKNSLSHRKIQSEVLEEEAPAIGGGFLTMEILHGYDIQGDKKGILKEIPFTTEYKSATGKYLEALDLLKENYPEFVNRKTNINEMNLSLNTILYGPPGTGKTYKFKNEFFEKFTDESSNQTEEEYLQELVGNYS